jgi:hypothetical protein
VRGLQGVAAGGVFMQRPRLVPVVHHAEGHRHGGPPRVGVAARRHRQWTLSLPFTLRFTVVKTPQLLKRLEVRLVQAVWRWQRREARRHGVTGPLRGGGVCFWQWFGSSLQ